MKNITTKSIFICVILFFALSCATKKDGVQPLEKNSTAQSSVSWHSGYRMPDFLEQSFEIKSLKDIELIMRYKWYDEFLVRHPKKTGTSISLSSCQEYFDLNVKQVFTVKESENAPFMAISAMCQATKAILEATPVKDSFLRTLEFDKDLPNKFPAQIAMVVSETESVILLNSKTIKYWSQINKISSVEKITPYHAVYKHDGGSQEIELVAKGDFNGDAIEDMLITSRDSVEGGSYSALRLMLITKPSSNSEYVFIQQYN